MRNILKLNIIIISVFSIISACILEEANPIVDQYAGTCEDGILNLMEEDIDCGGVCPACINPDMVVSSCSDQLTDNTFSGDLNIVFDSLSAFYQDRNRELIISAYNGSEIWEIGIHTSNDKITSGKYSLGKKRDFGWQKSAYIKKGEYGTFESYSGDIFVDVWYGKINVEFCDAWILENSIGLYYVSGKLFVRAKPN